jgi:uncharacterized protein (DUF58 family)
MTGRLVLLSLLAYGLVFAGLALVNGTLIALALPLVCFLAAALLFRPGAPRLNIRRTLSGQYVSPRTPVKVHLDITNEGEPLEELIVAESLTAPLERVDGQTRALMVLPSGVTSSLDYTLRGRRGKYPFRPIQIQIMDTLGLICFEEQVHLADSLSILPETWRLKRIPIHPLHTHGFAGPIPARQGGPGLDFYKVREYQPGDALRWINWRISARYNQTLFTNEYEQERITDIGIVLDARETMDVHTPSGDLFEHSVQAAASLAETFLNDGHRVGLLIYGRALEMTQPGYGKVQRERLLRALSNARTGDSMVFKGFDQIPTRFFPTHAQIIFISPLSQDDLSALAELRANGFQVLVISPDGVAFALKPVEKDTVEIALAARLARTERDLLLHSLERMGIQAVNWDLSTSLDGAIQAGLGKVGGGRGQAIRRPVSGSWLSKETE